MPRQPYSGAARARGALVLGLALALCVAGCSSLEGPSPTPSALARALLGQWRVSSGQEARLPITLGEQVTFQADGSYVWGARKGRYELFQDAQMTLRASLGESFSYDLTLTDDTLTLTRMTNCGKVEQFVLERRP